MPQSVSQLPLSSYVGLGFDPTSLLYQRDKQAQQYLGDYIALAKDIVNRIEGGSGSGGGWAEPLARDAITTALASPGMSAGEYAQAKGRVTGTFRAATGGLAKAAGNRGYFSPASTAQAAGNAPAATLAGGLADLQARNAEIARRERETGLSALTSIIPSELESARSRNQAIGSLVGQYMAGTPWDPNAAGAGSVNMPGQGRAAYYR